MRGSEIGVNVKDLRREKKSCNVRGDKRHDMIKQGTS